MKSYFSDVFIKLCLLVLSFALAWFIFPEYGYFPTQNSAYHAAIAQDYLDDRLPQLLPSSSLPDGYIDQHIFYNFLIAGVLPFFNEPWEALKFIQVFFLGLTFFVLLQFANRRKMIFQAVTAVFLLIYFGTGLNRLYFLRIESLVAFALVFGTFFSDKLLSSKYKWKWYLYFCVSCAVSWINLLSLIFLVPFKSKDKRESIIVILLSLLLFFTSLIAIAGGQRGIEYFSSIISQNFIENNGISEWEGPRNILSQFGFILSVSVTFIALVLRKKIINSSVVMRLTYLSVIVMILALNFVRFNLLLSIITSVQFYFILESFAVKERYRVLQLLFISLPLGLGVAFKVSSIYERSPYSVRREAPDIRAFAQWIKEQSAENENKKIINLFWEHWGVNLWYIPNWITEPGLTPKIYARTAGDGMKCLSRLRERKISLSAREWLDCQDILSKAFGTEYMLISKSESIRLYLNQMRRSYDILYQDGKVVFIKFNRNRLIDENIDLGLSWLLSPDYFYKKGELRSFYSDGKLYSMNKAEELRSVLSAASLCDRELLNKNICRDVLKTSWKYLESESISSMPAALGLLALSVDFKNQKIQDIAYDYLADIDSYGYFKSVRYGTSGEYFYPGEIILFLLKYSMATGQFDRHKEVIQRAVRNYTTQFLLNPHYFRVRWLAEVLEIYTQLAPDDRVAYGGAILLSQHVTRKSLDFCPPYNDKNHFVSGLWLEGVVRLPENLLSRGAKDDLFKCAAMTIKKHELLKGDKNRYFSGNISSDFLRVDTHVHTLSGVYDYLQIFSDY